MTLDVEVVRARCIGTKACVNAAPGTFAMDPTNVATVIDPSRGPSGPSEREARDSDADDDVIAAAEACPTGAVTVRRGDDRIV